jgi:hypothetical protein
MLNGMSFPLAKVTFRGGPWGRLGRKDSAVLASIRIRTAGPCEPPRDRGWLT